MNKRPFVSFVREDSDGNNVGGGTVVGPRNMKGGRGITGTSCITTHHHDVKYSSDARSETVSLQSVWKYASDGRVMN
jgi:hypothetical protein